MKHIKKFILLFMLIVTCSIITGCEEEASIINNPTNIDANHTHQDTNVDNDTISEMSGALSTVPRCNISKFTCNKGRR